MKITSSEFIRGIVGPNDILDRGIPQICFVGRSNVGKSSLINALVGKKDLVKTGKKPGKTTEINFFLINKNKFYFVDLPGYGYARGNKEKIRELILWYLAESGTKPFVVVLVLDSKVGLTDFDKDMLDVLRGEKHNYIIIANKSDKLNQKELSEKLKIIKIESGEENVFPYSAMNKKGTDELLKKILFGL